MSISSTSHDFHPVQTFNASAESNVSFTWKFGKSAVVEFGWLVGVESVLIFRTSFILSFSELYDYRYVI